MLNQKRNLTALQEWFISKGFEGLEDKEIIELLLSLVLPVQKAKRLAKACMERFQNLSDFLAASPMEQQEVGITPACMLCIKLLHELPAKVLKQRIVARSIYKSSKEVFDYLYYSMRDLKKEVFKVIYLNNRSQIIDTADLFEGTADNIPIRPREIIESTLTQGATGLIFVHNHPSGDPTPSRSDKQLTRDLVFVGNILQIKVLDHIIIGTDSYFSFTDVGLTQKYQDSFMNLKIRGVLSSKPLYHIYRQLPKGLRHQHLNKLFNEYQLPFPE
jgi:DNA repair protein RadC